MLPTRVLLGTALSLSFAALAAFLLQPRPAVPEPGVAVVAERAGLRLEARSSHTAVHERGSETFVELTVVDESAAPSRTPAVSLALVLDRSGSMSGTKLADAQRAAHQLVDLLGEDDHLGLVSFGTDVSVVPMQRMNAEGKAALHRSVDALVASGSTYLSGGLEAGRALLHDAPGVRRLVLVSDGQPTVGATSEGELLTLVGRTHDDAVTVTALGVGADYDGMMLSHLADRGGGMYGYLENASALDEVLGKEVAAARSGVARNVVLELKGDGVTIVGAPGRVLEPRLDGARLYLSDLRPRTPTRVLVRLQSRLAAPGSLAALDARVRWHDVTTASQETVGVQVAALVVEDERDVQRSRDEAVFARGIGAVGSLQLVAAAAAYERGDVAGASSMLDSARAIFGMSADALAGQSEVESVRRNFGSASALERKSLARGLERKKLTDFGKENSGY